MFLLAVCYAFFTTLPFNPPAGKDYSTIWKATPYEMVDRVVNDMCRDYPEVCPVEESRKIVLKRELIYLSFMKEDARNEVIAGFPSKFKILPVTIKKLKEISSRDFPSLSEKELKIIGEADHYLLFELFSKPVLALKKEKDAKYEGWSTLKISKDLIATQKKLMKIYHKDDPKTDLIEKLLINLQVREERHDEL